MNILLTYATNSSGTQQVADIVADVLQQAGHTVTIKRAYEPEADDFGTYDFVILGSCTWERFEGQKRLDGQLQQHMHELVEKNKATKIPGQKFAIFALGDSTYTHFCQAADHLENFVSALGGTLRVPTMRIDGFFFKLDEHRQQAEKWANEIVKSFA